MRAKKVDLELVPLHGIPESARSGIAAAATRYGVFLGRPVELLPSP